MYVLGQEELCILKQQLFIEDVLKYKQKLYLPCSWYLGWYWSGNGTDLDYVIN